MRVSTKFASQFLMQDQEKNILLELDLKTTVFSSKLFDESHYR